MTTQATTVIDKNGKTTTVHKKVPTYTASKRDAFRMPPPVSNIARSSVGIAMSAINAVQDAGDYLEEGMESAIGSILGNDDVFAADRREREYRRAEREALTRERARLTR